MRILVTGASGRIGARLTQALVRDGHTVRVLASADHPRAHLIAGPQVEFSAGRLEDVEAVNAAVKGVDAVYHLAAGLGSRGANEEQIFDLGLRGTFNVLRAVRDLAPGCRRFAYASSDAVHWQDLSTGACYLPIDEAHPRLAGSLYGAVKIGCEELCLQFMRSYGIPVTILRFGATTEPPELLDPTSRFAHWIHLQSAIRFYGRLNPAAGAQGETLRILRELDDGVDNLLIEQDLAGAPEVRQWGDARDVAEGCVLALENPAAVGETFLLGGVAPFRTDELITYMASKLGRPYVCANLPTTRRPWYISSAKARGILGYRPRHSIFDMADEAIAGLSSR
jgi:nucleoside-diphosphate-sugar epimerase